MRNFIFIILAIVSMSISAQEKINWLSFEEAIKKNEKEPKPILIDIYTDWCGWCKKMNNTTYKNKVIIKYINENYHPVKFNGEDKNNISFQGKTFTYKGEGRRGYHELAAALMKGNMSYPSTAFLSEDKQLLQNVPGYMNGKKFEKILAYFNNGNYKKSSWKDFKKKFKGSI